MTDNELGSRRPILLGDSRDRFLAGVKVFAREATEVGDLWYQYWIWYERDQDHDGDWEFVQVQIDPITRLPLAVAFAQHRRGVVVPWVYVDKWDGRPVVFVSRDKHASYPRNGWHLRRWRLDRADGKREIAYIFRIVTGDDVTVLTRRGRWGLDANSPLPPGRSLGWRRPSTWARRFPIKR